MSNKENGKPSLREKIRIYKSTLRGDVLSEFNKVLAEKEINLSLQKAFVAAKDAVQSLLKEKENG